MSAMATMGRKTAVLAALFTIVTSLQAVAGQNEAPPCLARLTTCQSYLLKDGSEPVPSPQCCNAFTTVLKDQVLCLCQLLNSNSSALFSTFDRAKMRGLPSKCGVNFGLGNCTSVTGGGTSDGNSATIASGILVIGGFFISLLFIAA